MSALNFSEIGLGMCVVYFQPNADLVRQNEERSKKKIEEQARQIEELEDRIKTLKQRNRELSKKSRGNFFSRRRNNPSAIEVSYISFIT